MPALELFGLTHFGAKLGSAELYKAVRARVRMMCGEMHAIVPLRVCVTKPMHPGGVAFGQFVAWYRSVVSLRGGGCAGERLEKEEESLEKGKGSLEKGKESVEKETERLAKGQGSLEKGRESAWKGDGC